MTGREFLPALRRAGLDDDRVPLRRRRGVERTARAVVGALEVNLPYLCRIGEGVGTRIHDHCVRLPACPELIAQLHVFVRPVVALVVFEHLMVAEVQRLFTLVGRHDVPGHAAATEVIQSGHQAREQERWIEGRRQGGCQADAARCRGHDGDQGTWVVKGCVLGVAEIGIHATLVGTWHRQAVPQHDQVKLGALEGDRHVLPEFRLGPVVPTPGPWARPTIQAEPGVGAERAEPHQVHFRHGCSIAPALTLPPVPGRGYGLRPRRVPAFSVTIRITRARQYY